MEQDVFNCEIVTGITNSELLEAALVIQVCDGKATVLKSRGQDCIIVVRHDVKG